MSNIHDDLHALTDAVRSLTDVLSRALEGEDLAGPAPEKPAKRKARKAKAAAEEPAPEQTEAVEAVEEETEAAPEPETEQEAGGTGTVTKDEVRVALQKLDRDVVAEILSQHGATVLRKLPESKYQSVFDAAKAAA